MTSSDIGLTYIPLTYEEIKDTTADVIAKFHSVSPDIMIGHFTQVVWAKTTHVGCAMSERKPDGKINYVACNYGTGGNMRNEPVYKKGTACSACQSGLKCNTQYKGLCGNTNVAEVLHGSNPYRDRGKLQNDLPCDYIYILLLVLASILR